MDNNIETQFNYAVKDLEQKTVISEEIKKQVEILNNLLSLASDLGLSVGIYGTSTIDLLLTRKKPSISISLTETIML